MPYAAINNFVANNLAGQVAVYLNAKVANFPNVNQYFSNHGYFSEATVQGVMFGCLKEWLAANENANHVLLLSELDYPHFQNRADLAVIYDNGGGPSRLFIELKADFTAASVNEDIEVLDAVASLQNTPLTDGYAFYVYRNGQAGWTQHIDDPLMNAVHKTGIGVQ